MISTDYCCKENDTPTEVKVPFSET